jgi:hypothetical protein
MMQMFGPIVDLSQLAGGHTAGAVLGEHEPDRAGRGGQGDGAVGGDLVGRAGGVSGQQRDGAIRGGPQGELVLVGKGGGGCAPLMERTDGASTVRPPSPQRRPERIRSDDRTSSIAPDCGEGSAKTTCAHT